MLPSFQVNFFRIVCYESTCKGFYLKKIEPAIQILYTYKVKIIGPHNLRNTCIFTKVTDILFILRGN